MKRNLYYASVFAASLGVLAGCASSRQGQPTITVSSMSEKLVPDSTNQLQLDLCFQVPEHYFSKRSRLVIVPQLVKEDSVCEEFLPLVVDAPIYKKKKERLEVLEGYVDPYADRVQGAAADRDYLELDYSERVQLPANADQGRIVAVVTTDGCGECTSMDTLDVAVVERPVVPEPEVKLDWIEPEFVIRPKVVEGRGEANLLFAINRHEINLKLGDNQTELEQMLQTLAPVLQDTLATFQQLTINGMASADGSLAFNTALAKRRAQAAYEWLMEHLESLQSVKHLIQTGAAPEGWEPVLAAMTADGCPDSVAVKDVLQRYADADDDTQERYIRRLPCWSVIKAKYLQQYRKVVYVYTYTLKSFTTDAELLDMYRKRPDAFNEEEFLRVAALTDSPAGKQEVYQTILQYFPESQAAANNLAVLYLREGRMAEAADLLKKLASQSPEAQQALELLNRRLNRADCIYSQRIGQPTQETCFRN